MAKTNHEFRDPIHVFVRLDSDERRILDSRPVQRLRHIHQLALSYLIYPGATHKRFEHSLGVMELAGRVFDVITHEESLRGDVRELLPESFKPKERDYWRGVLRMAALCHDIGHLPFSHAAERELLPQGWNHERLSQELILSAEMEALWKKMTPPLRSEDIVKLAVGRKIAGVTFSNWEAILSEIIVGDAFGVDRIDYLLRDSYHAGVAYGRFDHYRLIDTLRILISPETGEPVLGVEEGGIQSAEALALARYFMFTQVYLHPVRRVYDLHLKQYLQGWLPGGIFPTDLDDHLKITDSDVSAALWAASVDSAAPLHAAARRIVCREHYREVYRRNPRDVATNPEAGQQIAEGAADQFGPEHVLHDEYKQGGGTSDFPVLMKDGTVVPALSASQVLQELPIVAIDYVFVERSKFDEVKSWLAANREALISPKETEE